jgi:hypothetical protein
LNYAQDKEVFLCPFDAARGTAGPRPDQAHEELREPDADPPGLVQGDHPLSYMYEFSMAAPASSWGWFMASSNGYLFSVTLPICYLSGGELDYDGDADACVDLDGNPSVTMWGEAKTAQMRYGDTFLNSGADGDPRPKSTWHGYSPTRMPILRCYWHTPPDQWGTWPTDAGDLNAIQNLMYNGNVRKSPAAWEFLTKGY